MNNIEQMSLRQKINNLMIQIIEKRIAKECGRNVQINSDEFEMNLYIYHQFMVPAFILVLAETFCMMKFSDDFKLLVLCFGIIAAIYSLIFYLIKIKIPESLKNNNNFPITPPPSKTNKEITEEKLKLMCLNISLLLLIIFFAIGLSIISMERILESVIGFNLYIFSFSSIFFYTANFVFILIVWNEISSEGDSNRLRKLSFRIVTAEAAFLYRFSVYIMRFLNILPTLRRPTPSNSVGHMFLHDDYAPARCNVCKSFLIRNWPSLDRPWIEQCGECGSLHPTWARLDRDKPGSFYAQQSGHRVALPSILFLVPTHRAGAALALQLYGSEMAQIDQPPNLVLPMDSGTTREVAVRIHAVDKGSVWAGDFDLIVAVPPNTSPSNPLARAEDDLKALLSCVQFPQRPWTKHQPNAVHPAPAASPLASRLDRFKAAYRRVTQPPEQYRSHQFAWRFATVPVLAVLGNTCDLRTFPDRFGRIEGVNSPSDIAALLFKD